MNWTLDDGVRLVKLVQDDSREYGYHVCLGGSVINKGMSTEDVDLYFLPMEDGRNINSEALVKWLTSLWGEPKVLGYGPEPTGIGLGLRGAGPRNPFAEPRVGIFDPPPVPGIQQVEFRDDGEPVAVPKGKSKKTSVYKNKLKFMRGGSQGDRIDVFIL